jgi:hypothetical protein
MTKQLTLLTRMLRLQKLYADRRAWTKFEFWTRKANHTCYCLVGGLNKVRGATQSDLMCTMPDELQALEFDTQTNIYFWNDDPERTIKDIRERVALGVKNARKLSKQKSTEKSQ